MLLHVPSAEDCIVASSTIKTRMGSFRSCRWSPIFHDCRHAQGDDVPRGEHGFQGPVSQRSKGGE